MTKNKLYFLAFLLIFGTSVKAQQYNELPEFLKANSVWTFGNYAGLDFNSGSPVPITDSFNDHPNTPGQPFAYNESGVSVADPVTGELLFYFDGHSVRNKNHHTMPNGRDIKSKAYTGTQGSLIVPVIDSPGKYYLFSLHGPSGYLSSEKPEAFLFYSKIDMSLNNGLGDIVAGQKNIILDTDSLSESMIAIPGDNCDIWVLVHTYHRAKFKAYHITKDGLNTNPVISITGSQIERAIDTAGLSVKSYYIGGMAASPDRQRIAISSYYPYAALFNLEYGYIPRGWVGVLLCKFDPGTGIVSDAIQVAENMNTYTLAFSPDNSKLYMTNLITMQKTLEQFDVSDFDSSAIANSQTTISTVPINDILEAYLKLYNGKIYFNTNVGITTLSTINQPNLSGAACDYQYGNISLLPGTSTQAGLTNEVVYPMPPDTLYSTTDSMICTGWNEGVILRPKYIADGYSYIWDDGTTDTNRRITASGTYWVKYTNDCNYGIDSFILTGSDIEAIINVNEFVLSTTDTYATYQWYVDGNIIQGATDRFYTVIRNGNYTVVVSNEEGCIDTSEIYTVDNYTSIHQFNARQEVKIYPNPSNDLFHIDASIKVNVTLSSLEGKVIKQAEDVQKVSLAELAEGVYLLHISDQNGNLITVEKLIKIY